MIQDFDQGVSTPNVKLLDNQAIKNNAYVEDVPTLIIGFEHP